MEDSGCARGGEVIYKCEACGKEFEGAWTDEEADAEAKKNFGVSAASRRGDMAVVCDECYCKLMRSLA